MHFPFVSDQYLGVDRVVNWNVSDISSEQNQIAAVINGLIQVMHDYVRFTEK